MDIRLLIPQSIRTFYGKLKGHGVKIWKIFGNLYLIKPHFYNPLPDINELQKHSNEWDNFFEIAMQQIVLNLSEQFIFLKQILPLFKEECKKIVDGTHPMGYIQ